MVRHLLRHRQRDADLGGGGVVPGWGRGRGERSSVPPARTPSPRCQGHPIRGALAPREDPRRVRVGAGWYRVERASAKSVTVAGDFGPCRVPYHKLYDHHRLTDETRLATAYLNARGWRILTYAWPTDDGAELELVAMDADRTPVAFLIRSSDKTNPLALITQADVDTTHHAAAAWAATQPSPSPAPRVDALGIQGQLITHVHDL